MEKLVDFLKVDFTLVPLKLRSKCISRACKMPYFEASHSREKYCCKHCRRVAELKSKRNSWTKNREKWRPKSKL